ncbi:uncharacterized protein LOC122859906 [Aphidius gifuensis]|uniref:uncharacterized protein LOC122859906 n=1 Tax=Aphidius gifuensis TaxID=684658 RepID=UPI001CDCC441|nr:uncharacterized protein LOC122859906 [Aphidius gifuensis]
MDMGSLETLLAPHRDALRRLCETEMNWRYAQRMNRPIPPVLRRRNLVLIKYHIEAILRGLLASTIIIFMSIYKFFLAKYSLIPDGRYGTTITVELCSVTYESDQEMDVNQESDTETNEVSSTQNNDVAIED